MRHFHDPLRSSRIPSRRASPPRRAARATWSLLAVAAVSCLAALLLPTGSGAQAKPQPACDGRTLCPACFYYNRNDPGDLDLINQHRLVVLNQDWQIETLLPGISDSTLALFYFLIDFTPESAPFYDWPTVNAHEDWFLHTDAGERIRFPHVEWPYWYMDVSNAEYLEHRIGRYRWLLEQYPALDGFFLDGPGAYGDTIPPCEGFACYVLRDLPCYHESSCPAAFESEAAWNAFYNPALEAATDSLPGALVISNDFLYPPHNEILDGSLGEHLFHASFWGDDFFYTETDWRRRVDLLADPSLASRVALVLSGTWPDSSDVTRWFRFSAASFLLGRRTDNHSLFAFSTSRTLEGVTYDPLYDIDIGQPIDAYRPADGAYVRDYDGGLVLVNPTTGPRTVTLDPEWIYTDLDGNFVATSITLVPNSGQVLTISGPATLEGGFAEMGIVLERPAPSPFRERVVLAFSLPAPMPARLEVFDSQGRRVAGLANGAFPEGRQTAEWLGRDDRGNEAPDGIYFIRLQAGEATRVQKVSLRR